MPLTKKLSSNSEETATTSATPQTGGLIEPERNHSSRAQKEMTKDDYWRRREERDIETGVRIRRSGVIQAAAMSVGTSQYNLGSTIDSYADVVEKLAERMLAWVNR